MSSSNIFKSEVLPVLKEEQHKMEEAKKKELLKHQSSLGRNMLGGIGPDGGMTATNLYDNTINITGEWNKKTADDYLNAVKESLSKKHPNNITTRKQKHSLPTVISPENVLTAIRKALTATNAKSAEPHFLLQILSTRKAPSAAANR